MYKETSGWLFSLAAFMLVSRHEDPCLLSKRPGHNKADSGNTLQTGRPLRRQTNGRKRDKAKAYSSGSSGAHQGGMLTFRTGQDEKGQKGEGRLALVQNVVVCGPVGRMRLVVCTQCRLTCTYGARRVGQKHQSNEGTRAALQERDDARPVESCCPTRAPAQQAAYVTHGNKAQTARPKRDARGQITRLCLRGDRTEESGTEGSTLVSRAFQGTSGR